MSSCFIDKTKQIERFNPEISVEELPVGEEEYKKYFMKDDNIDFKKLRLTNIGSYSIARPDIAEKITEQIKKDHGEHITITDAFGNMGGMTCILAKTFDKVNSVEIVPTHCEVLQNNIDVYGLTKKVKVTCGDYMDYMNTLEQDVIVFDPPWGGTDYKKQKYLKLGLNNMNIVCVINKIMNRAKSIYMMVPHNYSFKDLDMLNSNIRYTKRKLEPERNNFSKYLLVFSAKERTARARSVKRTASRRLSLKGK
jgi:predicted RNA methylase